MTNYEWLTTLSIEQLAQWLDTNGHYEDSPWMIWFNKRYCSKCESEFIKREDSMSKLGFEGFEGFEFLSDKEIECAYCEVHDECRFFPNRKNPCTQEIIEMWLKEAI